MSQEQIGTELASVLSRLTKFRPRERVVSDWSDEHERWWLYSELLDDASVRELLLEAVQLEPDLSVASSVSMDMVARPDESPSRWIAALPGDSRQAELVAQRAGDLRVLLDVLAGQHVGPDEALGKWSDWLQRRVAEQCSDPELLRRLSAQANTSKVRRQAQDRARQLTGGRSGT
ncbi:hypothetical protein [Pengzhenrongella sicca]|uniref:Uncharacterized protein n=1 Tax=Pengzhenrongella sicca TaxID=2819238 RepID=A0A8A4ZK04_9MICO|nr:hypothetical protein [Pengzhenrongella sicca]QTE30867.1 hypothetical protein J4E96_08045 [Pengzhenrongella sicca]